MGETPLQKMGGLTAPEIELIVRDRQSGQDEKWAKAMGELEGKVDAVLVGMAQVVGTKELPGLLIRLEAKVDELQSDQQVLLDRRGVDDAFRTDLSKRMTYVEKEVRAIRSLITVMKFFWSLVHGMGDAASGKAPKTLWAIFGGVTWIAVMQFWHTGWPMIRESIKHHRLMH